VAERYIFGSPTLENHGTNSVGFQTTLPVLDNPFSQRVNAVIQKTREMRRGVYHPHLYVVKEDGEPPLRLWALSGLIQDRADVLPSYQQFIGQLKDKVRFPGRAHQSCD
jgi:protein transport protein SEC24